MTAYGRVRNTALAVRRRRRRRFASAATVLLLTAAAEAPAWTLRQELCFDGRRSVGLALPDLVPGCPLLGCCSDCDPAAPLRWRVRVQGPVTVSFQFPGKAEHRPEVRGEDVRLRDGRTFVGAGTADFVDVPVGAGSVAMRLALRPEVGTGPSDLGDEEGVGAARQGSPALGAVGAAAGGVFDVEIDIEQRVGERTVARADARLRFRYCGSLRGRDRIDLEAREASGEALILVDGRRDQGCVDDEPWTAEDIVYVGNLLERRECHEEVVVFAPGDAIAVWSPSSVLDAATEDPHRESVATESGDSERLPLPPSERPAVARYGFGDHDSERLVVPLSGRRRSLGVVLHWYGAAEVAARARDELTLADALLDRSRCGIEVLRHAVVLPVPRDAVARVDAAAVQAMRGDCRAARRLVGDAGLLGDAGVDVFVSARPWTARTCREEGLVFLGRLAGPTSLAHALGHTLGLGHASGIDGPVDYDGDGEGDFGSHNLMWNSSGTRIGLRAGQCFRASFSPASSLLRYAQPGVPARDCSMTQRGVRCPAVSAQPFGVSW